MGEELYQRYAAAPDVSYADVRHALDGIEPDDLSQSSPIDSGESIGIQLHGVDGDPGGVVELRVQGYDGDWTKTSQRAIRRAVQSVDGVGEKMEQTGGYNSGDDE